jgi:hypothetical protein
MPIIDAAIDEVGIIWVLCTDGLLHRLRWTDRGLAAAGEPSANPHVGQDSALVQHAAGVTLIDGETEQAVRFGTDIDGIVPLPDLGPGLLTPIRAAAHLIPLAVKDEPTALLVTPDSVIRIDLGSYGCGAAGSSAGQDAYAVFVCPAARKALVFDAAGRYVAPDIELGPTGDPILAWDRDTGRIFVALPGGPAVTIEKDGTRSTIAAGPPVGGAGEPTRTAPANVAVGGGAVPPAPPPAAPVARPRNGDGVIASVGAQQHAAPGEVSPECQAIAQQYQYQPIPPEVAAWVWAYCYPTTYVYFTYTATLAPPTTWRDFSGTCTLLLTTGAGPTERMIDCMASTAALGTGDGTTWTVSVRACDAPAVCVTSAPVTVPTSQAYPA